MKINQLKWEARENLPNYLLISIDAIGVEDSFPFHLAEYLFETVVCPCESCDIKVMRKDLVENSELGAAIHS